MKIQQEKEFKTREDLDAFIRGNFGDGTNIVELHLTENEAKKLMLSEKNLVYGAKVRVAKVEAEVVETSEVLETPVEGIVKPSVKVVN